VKKEGKERPSEALAKDLARPLAREFRYALTVYVTFN
jgi:hypothetical protein